MTSLSLLAGRTVDEIENRYKQILVIIGMIHINLVSSIPESPPQMENRNMAWVYVKSIRRSTMY